MTYKHKNKRGAKHPCKSNSDTLKCAYKPHNSEINLISWNIQSSRTVGGNKFDDTEFKEILARNDIICLQEIRQAQKLRGYRSHSVLRDTEKSGGVGIFYKNEFNPGIQIMKKYETTDVIVCKLKKSFFKFKTDRYIINAYVTPASSSGSNNIDGKELLFKISNIVNELQKEGHVYLCGDFNSRISNHPGLIQTDHSNRHLPLPDDCVCDNFTARSSRDGSTNGFCKDFLSLIMNNSLTIANGRTLGDFMGNYTCITPRGSSVVDYFAISSQIYHTVTKMVVLPFTIFSDHRPLRTTLATDILDVSPSLPIDSIYETAPVKYIYDNNSKAQFMEIQSFEEYTDHHDKLRLKLKLCESKQNGNITRPDVNELNETFTTFINDMAAKCFKTTNLRKNEGRGSRGLIGHAGTGSACSTKLPGQHQNFLTVIS